jgi:hypothetical protein
MTKHVFILGIILLAIFTGGGAKTPVNPEEPPDTSWHTWRYHQEVMSFDIYQIS